MESETADAMTEQQPRMQAGMVGNMAGYHPLP